MIPLVMLPSRALLLRPSSEMVDGVLTVTMVEAPALSEELAAMLGLEVGSAFPLRLEVGFYRPGKDMPLPIQAGRAPDRVAVYWCFPGTDLRPGDHLQMVSGPVIGSWHIKAYPDRALDMDTLHHLEGQCVEVLGQRGDS